jgi:hypothetical protein
MRIQTVIGAALSVIVFCAGVVNLGLSEEKDRELSFALSWPVGTTALVETTVEKQKKIEGQQPQNIKWTGKYRMTVEKAEGEGIAVRFDAQGRAPTLTKDGSPMPI